MGVTAQWNFYQAKLLLLELYFFHIIKTQPNPASLIFESCGRFIVPGSMYYFWYWCPSALESISRPPWEPNSHSCLWTNTIPSRFLCLFNFNAIVPLNTLFQLISQDTRSPAPLNYSACSNFWRQHANKACQQIFRHLRWKAYVSWRHE